jgi:Uncharacterized protein conserved in bacteria (DUF2252)
VVDTAIKVVGVSSLGTRCFVTLLHDEHHEPLFLRIKEARRLLDMKVSTELEQHSASRLARYGELCGRTLARAHAKAAQAPPSAGYLGSSIIFDDAIEKYAVASADQVERETFRVVLRNGLIRTEASGSLLETMLA